MYSKIIAEVSPHMNYGITIGAVVLYGAYHVFVKYSHLIPDFAPHSYIIIQSHPRIYRSFCNPPTEIVKTLYSSRFNALTHYLLKMQISSMALTEVMRTGDDGFYDTTTEYVLMPTHNNKIKITDDIFFEINIHYAFSDEKKLHKQYSYKLSIPKKDKTNIINAFLKNCEEEYITETENKSQLLFEFIGTRISNDKTELVYNEVFFKSNKHLDKNIFCENKQELIEYIDQFKRIPDDYTRAAELRYEHFGMTFRATMLLYGPPGCGKSSFIRGVLNRTGKYGIYVQWSKIKTCATFTSIFRSRTINGRKLALNDLCFIFEDFELLNYEAAPHIKADVSV